MSTVLSCIFCNQALNIKLLWAARATCEEQRLCPPQPAVHINCHERPRTHLFKFTYELLWSHPGAGLCSPTLRASMVVLKVMEILLFTSDKHDCRVTKEDW